MTALSYKNDPFFFFFSHLLIKLLAFSAIFCLLSLLKQCIYDQGKPFATSHFSFGFVVHLRDRTGYDVNQTVVHSVVTSFVDVAEYKKKSPLEVRRMFIFFLCNVK